MKKSAAIYAGSFDPLTNGHVDIVMRGLKTFDTIIFAVANNSNKKHLFDLETRMQLARESFKGVKGVEIQTFDGLLVDFAQKSEINVMLRGLRAVNDFEYEFQLATMNRSLNPNIETILMMTSQEWFFISSNIIKEAAKFGGDVSQMVPKPVWNALQSKFKSKSI